MAGTPDKGTGGWGQSKHILSKWRTLRPRLRLRISPTTDKLGLMSQRRRNGRPGIRCTKGSRSSAESKDDLAHVFAPLHPLRGFVHLMKGEYRIHNRSKSLLNQVWDDLMRKCLGGQYSLLHRCAGFRNLHLLWKSRSCGVLDPGCFP